MSRDILFSVQEKIGQTTWMMEQSGKNAQTTLSEKPTTATNSSKTTGDEAEQEKSLLTSKMLAHCCLLSVGRDGHQDQSRGIEVNVVAKR